MIKQNKWLVGSVSALAISSAVLWEGTVNTPYYDLVGVLTVCHGYTGKDIVKGKTYTPQECRNLLGKELKVAGDAVLECVTVPLSKQQFDALQLFVYNVGAGAFCKSNTVLKPLNQGKYDVAADGLLRWSYAKGKYIQGLNNRRQFERAMFKGELNDFLSKKQVDSLRVSCMRDAKYGTDVSCVFD